jgi:hypothetical protein
MTQPLKIDPKDQSKDWARGRPFSSRPELSRGWPYRQFRRKGKLRRQSCGSGRLRGARRDPPQEIGKLDGKLDPFTDLVGPRAVMGGGVLQLAELAQQELEALGQEPLAETDVLPRPREIGVGDQRRFMHVRMSRLPDSTARTYGSRSCGTNRVVQVLCGPSRRAVRSEALALFYAHQGCRPVRNQGFPMVTKAVAGRRALRYALCQ